MTSLRFLFVVVAVVACAAQSHGQRSSRPQLAASKAIAGLESQLNSFAVGGAAGDAIQNAVEKVKKIVKDIEGKIVSAEHKLRNRLQEISIHIADKISDVIFNVTKIKLDLSGDWLALENKVQNCETNVQPELQALVKSIKEKAETCVSAEIEKAKEIESQIVELFEIVDTVPEQAIKNIKKCSSSPASDDSNSDSGDASNTSGDSTGEKGVNSLRLRGLPSLETIKCVSKQLLKAIEGVKAVPELVYDLTKEIQSLASKETKEKIQGCAATSLAGSETELQQAAADLVTCIVAPSTNPEDQPQPQPSQTE